MTTFGGGGDGLDESDDPELTDGCGCCCCDGGDEGGDDEGGDEGDDGDDDEAGAALTMFRSNKM